MSTNLFAASNLILFITSQSLSQPPFAINKLKTLKSKYLLFISLKTLKKIFFKYSKLLTIIKTHVKNFKIKKKIQSKLRLQSKKKTFSFSQLFSAKVNLLWCLEIPFFFVIS